MGRLQITSFRSKIGPIKKVIRKVERYAIVPFRSRVNRQSWSKKRNDNTFALSTCVGIVVVNKFSLWTFALQIP